jgi:hypothetical protein
MDRGSQERVSHSGFYIASLQLTTAKHTTRKYPFDVCVVQGGTGLSNASQATQRLPSKNTHN